jgi:hypothetical protein
MSGDHRGSGGPPALSISIDDLSAFTYSIVTTRATNKLTTYAYHIQQPATTFSDDEGIEVLEPIKNDICPKCLKGECMYDEENLCSDQHPEELDSDISPREDLKDFEISDVRGQACMRCLDKSVPVRSSVNSITRRMEY